MKPVWMARSLLRQVSQLFLWGFKGKRITKSLEEALRRFPPAGLVLFRRNIESPRQLADLIRDAQKSSPYPLLIGIDQEGGRVSRLPPPWVQYPPARDWGRLDPELMRKIGHFMGQELKRSGINLNFAPVLDVDTNPLNPIIGNRAFGRHPEEVIRSAIPFAQGLMDAGVIPCGKHFPGHGDTSLDSHKELPVVPKGLKHLKRIELVPFVAAIRAGLPMLMTAHVLYPELDPKNAATVSQPILEGLLRKGMGFNGVIISDDLDMKALASKHSLSERVLAAFRAGVDLILICKDFAKRGKVVEDLTLEIRRSRFLQERMKASLGRIEALRRKHLK